MAQWHNLLSVGSISDQHLGLFFVSHRIYVVKHPNKVVASQPSLTRVLAQSRRHRSNGLYPLPCGELTTAMKVPTSPSLEVYIIADPLIAGKAL